MWCWLQCRCCFRQIRLNLGDGLLVGWLRSCAALLAAAVLLPVTYDVAHAKRVALVVGISDYAYSPKLANPGRDAAGMAAALAASGFEVVQSLDQDLGGLLQALEQFYAKTDGAEVALFFFAGHGLQFDGVNYLVPKNAQLRSDTRLKQETIALQDIISSIEKRAGITLVFLDACRDNPLAEELHRSSKGASRSAAVPRGLAPMAIRNPDTLLVFAAAPGRTAADGAGDNSPFTTAILRNIAEPGVEIELMMKRVTRDVVQSTGGEQVPERLSRLTTEFVFHKKPLDWNPTTTPAKPPTTSSAGPARTKEAEAKGTGAVASLPKGNTVGDCVVLGSRLEKSIPVRVGTQLCSRNGQVRATIEEITSFSVVYSVWGQRSTCRRTEICSFNWDGAPLFNIAVSTSPGGAEHRAELLPNSL
jgi:Caspase domain